LSREEHADALSIGRLERNPAFEHKEAWQMTENPLVGAWRLLSCEFRGADGQIRYPFGRDLAGYILYGQDGYMSVAIMGGDRPTFAAGDIRDGTVEEKVAASDTYISYCGRYDIQGDRVIHHIEVSFFPNWVGADQERFFELDGDQLSLRTPLLLVNGVQQAGYLVWKRV
jgi:hypothetical protein